MTWDFAFGENIGRNRGAQCPYNGDRVKQDDQGAFLGEKDEMRQSDDGGSAASEVASGGGPGEDNGAREAARNGKRKANDRKAARNGASDNGNGKPNSGNPTKAHTGAADGRANQSARKLSSDPHRRTSTTKALLTPAIWGIGIALGCSMAWPLMAFQSMNLYKGLPLYETALDQSYLLSIVATTITLLLCGIFHKQFDRMLGSVAARFIFPAGLCVSTLLILGVGIDDQVGLTGGLFVTAFGVGTGVFSALFLMNFGAVMGTLTLKQSAATIAIGYLSSTLLFFMFLFFGRFEAVIFCASMGPVAAAFLFYGVSNLKITKKQSNALPRQSVTEDPAERGQLHELMAAFSLTMLVTGASYELSRTLYVQMGQFASTDVVPYAIMQGGVTTLTIVGTIAIALVLITKSGIRGPEICYRMIVLFLIIGAMLVPLPLIFTDISPIAPLAVDVAAFQCMGMGMWLLISGLCRKYQTSCLFAFGIIRAAWSAGPLLGMLIGRWLWYGAGLDIKGAFVTACVCVCLIVVVNNFIFTENALARALSIMPTGRKQHFQDRCRAVIERYGLTEREGEVMILFAKGRNLPYVQEELCLSKSTVSTHRQHIYQKLGVHSSQEMIDLIQNEKA